MESLIGGRPKKLAGAGVIWIKAQSVSRIKPADMTSDHDKGPILLEPVDLATAAFPRSRLAPRSAGWVSVIAIVTGGIGDAAA